MNRFYRRTKRDEIELKVVCILQRVLFHNVPVLNCAESILGYFKLTPTAFEINLALPVTLVKDYNQCGENYDYANKLCNRNFLKKFLDHFQVFFFVKLNFTKNFVKLYSLSETLYFLRKKNVLLGFVILLSNFIKKQDKTV
jgi:hypothetical protein